MNYAEQLAKQLRFLQNSCEAYDQGNKDEAIRLATTIRTICHHTPNSTSLLTHLKVQHLKVLSTAEIIPKVVKFWPNLTVIKLSPVERWAEYHPKLDTARTKRFIPFEDWWRSEKVYVVMKDTITRKKLVLAAANKDGGAHVDTKLDPMYEDILNGAGWKMTLNPATENRDIPFRYGHLAALRQIAYEVLNTPEIAALAQSVT